MSRETESCNNTLICLFCAHICLFCTFLLPLVTGCDEEIFRAECQLGVGGSPLPPPLPFWHLLPQFPMQSEFCLHASKHSEHPSVWYQHGWQAREQCPVYHWIFVEFGDRVLLLETVLSTQPVVASRADNVKLLMASWWCHAFCFHVHWVPYKNTVCLKLSYNFAIWIS